MLGSIIFDKYIADNETSKILIRNNVKKSIFLKCQVTKNVIIALNIGMLDLKHNRTVCKGINEDAVLQ